MKKAVYLIVGGFMWASSIFGSAYTETDFEQIPSFELHQFSEVREFFRDGAIKINEREWKYAFSDPRRRIEPASFLTGGTEGISVKIEKFSAAARAPFFTFEGRLYLLVSLEINEENDEIEGFEESFPIAVSTEVDPKLSANPLVGLTAVNSIKEITDAVESKSGSVWERFSKIFLPRPDEK